MRKGQLVIQLIVFGTVALILISGLVLWAVSSLQISLRAYHRALAFTIAEAGIEYYRWHLAHDPLDFEDGTGGPGPYAHDYFDKDGNLLGQFILDITPPPPGSTVVTIQSTGRIAADPTVEKIIKVRLGISSLSIYALITHVQLDLGSSTNVYGRAHSNGGIRFDGVAYNLVSGSRSDYDDPSHGGGVEFGVHTHVPPVDPLPPNPVPNRPDVFTAGRLFPVPVVDFDTLSGDLALIRALAQAGGFFATSSGKAGYHMVLKPDDTFDWYRVEKVQRPPPGCTSIQNQRGQDGWGTWSIEQETLLGNYSLPANNLAFVEDDLWVDGAVDGARLTIANGVFPDNPQTRKNITVNNDLRYTSYDGQDVIGLIAQNNLNVGLISEDDLRIDAAVVSKNGRFGRYYYRPQGAQGQGGCQPYHTRTLLTTYGMIASYQDIQFSYGEATGYLTRTFNYDANLLYSPPPQFPTVGDAYEQISWDEVR